MGNQELVKLDVKDRKILLELERDARLSNRAIAKKVGLNTDLVRYRINKLQREGVICWFLTFVNFAKLGYTDYGIYLNTQKLTQEKEKEFIRYFQQHKHVTFFAKLGGKYDFFIGLLAQDIFEFQELISRIMDRYGDHISNKDIAIRVQLFHFIKKYLLDQKEKSNSMPHFGGRLEKEEIDELDKNIFQQLSTDARMDMVALAKKLKTPASTISARIKKLKQRKIIEGFFIFMQCQSYGYQNHIITLTLKNPSKQQENKLYSFCEKHPHIVYLIKTVGKWDYELSVEIPHQEKYQELLTQLREEFSDILLNMESIILFENLKYSLYPF